MADGTRLKRYTTLAAAVDMLVEQRLALLNPSKWQDTNETYFLEMFQEHIRAKSLYAACFTQTNETFHHWKVFAGDNEGVCIEIDRAALLGSLLESSSYHWSDVNYCTIAQLNLRKRINAFELPFLKRKGFGDEKEFRLIYWSRVHPQHGVQYITIERSWIKAVVLNPWIGEALFKSMKVALNSIPGCSDVLVRRTTLVDNAQWKEAADKVEELPLTVKQPDRSI